MNAKILSFFAVFLVAVVALVAVNALADNYIEEMTVYVDGIKTSHVATSCVYNEGTETWELQTTKVPYNEPIGLTRGDRIPVKVRFTVNGEVNECSSEDDADDLGNVRVRSAIFGYRYDITDVTGRFHAYRGKTYTRTLYLDLPEDMDTGDSHEDYEMYVSITDSTDLGGADSTSFIVDIQRESYKLSNLNVEVGRVNGCCLTVPFDGQDGICGECYNSVEADTKVAFDVVIKNMGQDEQEDVWVEASIPGLCTSRKVYVGDIVPYDTNDADDDEDTVQATIYLHLPANMNAGTYDVVIRAWSDDSEVEVTEKITVTEAVSESGVSEVYASNTKMDVNKGETAAYKLTIVNVGEGAKTYTVGVSGAETWSNVEVTPSVVRLNGDASAEVTVYVTVDEDAVAGDHIFTVSVYSDGETISEYNVIASVEGQDAGDVDVKLALLIGAIILAVVIVVLLIVLIARMASKGNEEVPEETAYY